MLYMLVGLVFIPFGVVYGFLRTHHQNSWFVLGAPLLGGLILASLVRAMFQRWTGFSGRVADESRDQTRVALKIQRSRS